MEIYLLLFPLVAFGVTTKRTGLLVSLLGLFIYFIYKLPSSYMSLEFFNFTLLYLVLVLTAYYVKSSIQKRDRALIDLNKSLSKSIEKELEESLKSKVLFETIFNTVKDGVAIIDINLKFLLVNDAYSKMLEFTKEELYNVAYTSLTTLEMVQKSKDALKIAKVQGYYNGLEKQCITKNKKRLDVKVEIILMPDKESFLLVVKDITSNKEDALKIKKQEKLMFQQSRLAQLGEMISMIAHQWRQPLSAIATTSIDLQIKTKLKTFDKGMEGEEYLLDRLENINNYVHSLTNTIDDFRNFYKPNKQAVLINLEKIVEKSLDIIKASLLNDNINIIKEYNSTKEIELYDSEMMQVILNLLKNAQDSFKEKSIQNPYIKIIIDENSLSIIDNGGGIENEIIDRVFDPYFSTKNTKNGTGLGLYMSKTIVEEHHNAQLNVHNQENGVCFSIKFLDKK